jgi:carboxylesterase type B
VYQFDRPDPGQKVAQHSSELPYVFGYLPPAANADDRAISAIVGDYWTTFAKTGSPSGAAGAPAWPRFKASRKTYLEFPAVGAAVKSEDGLGGAACEVLRGDVLPGTH